MNTKLLVFLTATLPLAAIAQISYTGGVYTQDFNTLQSGTIYTPYTTFPAGWTVSSTYNSGSYVWTTITNGYSNNYGKYCFSLSASDPDKSIGLVIGSTGQAYLGARFHNATGVTLTSFSLSYYAKQWAKGAVTSADQTIPFFYSLDATNLTSGTYVSVPSLDMHSINDGDGVFAALDGNAVSNQQFIASTVSGISWLPDQDLWIQWSGVSHPFTQSHAMAVGDVVFSAVPKIQILAVSPTHLQIQWPTNYSGYTLQSATTPMPASWDTVTNVPVIIGSEFDVEIDTTEALRFFRLQLQ
jgi:hypothetical protein